MNDNICTDNRFEMIEKYLELLKQGTNIETSQEEMRTIQNILFRFWQMGWLDKIEFADTIVRCKDCMYFKSGWCMKEDIRYGYVCGDDATTFEPDEDFWCKYGERKETNDM